MIVMMLFLLDKRRRRSSEATVPAVPLGSHQQLQLHQQVSEIRTNPSRRSQPEEPDRPEVRNRRNPFRRNQSRGRRNPPLSDDRSRRKPPHAAGPAARVPRSPLHNPQLHLQLLPEVVHLAVPPRHPLAHPHQQ